MIIQMNYEKILILRGANVLQHILSEGTDSRGILHIQFGGFFKNYKITRFRLFPRAALLQNDGSAVARYENFDLPTFNFVRVIFHCFICWTFGPVDFLSRLELPGDQFRHWKDDRFC
ncbi:hypothetical protein RF11_10537 [Thelohanellus kitauei]|uniref:Uncharacterized protein n=1 Tax=Thelohanellus kitauei TaxID=669202 RepID=A0A0C2IV26_THEKT|nr:hypothetical protein RF11_10537 [Thelohanellus kitauei]